MKFIRKAHVVKAIQITHEFMRGVKYREIEGMDVSIELTWDGKLMIETCHYNDHYDISRCDFGVWIVVDEHGLSWVITDKQFKRKYERTPCGLHDALVIED